MSLSTLIDNLRSLCPRVDENTVAKHSRFAHLFYNATSRATTTAIAETAAEGGGVKMKSRLMKVELFLDAAVTGTATNFFTLLVRKRTAALPGTQVALVTFAADTVTTDDVAAFTVKDLLAVSTWVAGSATDFDFAEGDVVTAEVTKSGSGMTFPIGQLKLTFEPRD